MLKRKRDILMYVESEVQFDSLKPLLVYLRDNTKISFDIVVPKGGAINEKVYESAARALIRNDFTVVRGLGDIILSSSITSTKYKLFLSAYMYHWHYYNIDTKYRIMFPYASYYFNKPQWTIKHFIDEDYLSDALLSHATETKLVTDIFTKTYIVPSLKLMNFQKKSRNKIKPILFFAPTYNEIDFAVNFLSVIDDIKNEYTVIMRGHHKVTHEENNKDTSSKLYEKADQIYDSDKYSIITPLEEADIVVSDNSAVIFDAIYCGVPVALFSRNSNSLHYKDINTIQSKLVKDGDVLWADDPKKILHIVNETLTAKSLKKQQAMRLRLFPKTNSTDPVRQWMDILIAYLDDNVPYEYSLAKKYWIEHIDAAIEKDKTMNTKIENLHAQITNNNSRIYNEQNPGIKTALKRFIKACMYKLGLIKRIR